MGATLGSAFGDLVSNYTAGQQRQQAISRQVQQQTLQNAIEQQRASDAHQAALSQQAMAPLTLAEHYAGLVNQGVQFGQPTPPPATPPDPTPTGPMADDGAAPPVPTPGTLGAAVAGNSAPSVNLGTYNGQPMTMALGQTPQQKRTRAISAVKTEFSGLGQNLTDDQAAALVDGPPAVLDAQLRIAATNNKPDKVVAPKVVSEFRTKSGGIVQQTSDGKYVDADGNALAAKDIVAANASESAAQLAANDIARQRLAWEQSKGNPNAQAAATYLQSLEQQHQTINSLGVPNLAARMASHLPLVGNAAEGELSAATQQMGPAGDAWIANAVQTMKALRMSPTSVKFMRDTYVPQAGDTPTTIAQKNANRESFMTRLRSASQAGASTGASDNPYMHD